MGKAVVTKHRFYRKPLGAVNEKVSVPIGWFALPFHIIKGKDVRRNFHGKWFRIESEHMKIYRVLRFAGGIKKDETFKDADYILLDWVGWIDLCNREEIVKRDLVLTISQITFWEYITAGLKHPEPMFRLSVILAILSVSLGVISVIMASIAFCN